MADDRDQHNSHNSERGSKKRKERNNDSETDAFATEKGIKKNNTTLLGDNSVEGSLDFRPTSTPNTNLPRSIPMPTMAPKTEKTVTLPVVVQLKGGQTLELVTHVNKEEISKTFWGAIQKGLGKWTPLLHKEGFQVAEDVVEKELAVFADLMPGLLDQHGKLAFEKQNHRIPKEEYKVFLEGVRHRVNKLITANKEEIIDTKNLMTRLYVATSLQGPVVGTQTLTSPEDVRFLQSLASFYEANMDTIRRELASYGAVVSNLANKAQKQRIEISTIAKDLIALEPSTELPTSVSKVLMKVIGAHECLCQDCDPEYHEHLRASITQEAQAEDKEWMLEFVQQKYKNDLMGQVNEEWKVAEREKIRAEIKEEYAEKTRRAIMELM